MSYFLSGHIWKNKHASGAALSITTSVPNIRVIIVDDHPVVLEGLASGLSQYPGIEIVGTSCDFESGKALVDSGGFDLLVTDLYLSDERDGLKLLGHAKKSNNGFKTAVLTYSARADDVFDANEAGADAYLIKDSDLDEIAAAFRIIYDGGRPPLPPQLEAALWKKVRSGDAPPPSHGLNQRELEVLTLMTKGLTNMEIASRMFLSDRVVRRSNTAIFKKLGVRNRSEAVAKALQEKLV